MADEERERPVSELPPPPEDVEGGEEDEGEPEQEQDGRRRLERVLRDTIRRGLERGLEAGIGTLSKTDDVVRGLVGESGKLPKELVGYFFSSMDETKNALVRVVAREVREFLEATDLAQELQRALTSLSFEIKTEIRFIPNEAGGVKPDVKAKVAQRKQGRGTEPPPSSPDET